MAIHKFARLILDGKPLPFYGDGSSARDYTFIDDIIDGVVASIDRCDGGAHRVYNLGGSPVALTDWVAAIDAAVPGSGAQISLASTELPFPSEIAHDRLVELGDVVVTPYAEAIAETAAIYRRLVSEGRFVPSEHGVPTTRVSAGS